MTEAAQAKRDLQARYPLPDWVVDSKFKQGLTLAVANTICEEIENWPSFKGPTAQLDYAGHVTQAVRDTLKPWLTWLDDYDTDGFSYPGDPLVSYISQLALTRPGEPPDTDHYRELLRSYGRHLVQLAQRFDAPPTSAG